MNHTEIINKIIADNGYTSFLEIGTQAKSNNFDKIICESKYCVDPEPAAEADFLGTSDEFFAQNKETFSCVFLDGSHVCDDVLNDIHNSLNFLNEGGTIIMHDVNPGEEKFQIVPRISGRFTGDVWKAWVQWRQASKITMYVIDTDYGCGIIQRGSQVPLEVPESELTWENLVANRKSWLNLISVDEFLAR